MSLAIDPSQVRVQEETLAAALRRPDGLGRGWGLVGTTLTGAASFGVLPLVAWPIRMRDLFAGQAARLVEICRFAAPDPTSPQRQELLCAARRTAPMPLLWVLPVLAATFLACGGAVLLIGRGHMAFDRLVNATYRTGQTTTLDDPLGLLQSIFGVWSALLIGGYLLHVLHVQMHFSSMRRFLVRLNSVLARSGVQTIPLPRRAIVPGILWLAGGVALTACGAWWAVPMALAGSFQRRDAYQMHRQLSKVLADRIDAMLLVKAMPDWRCQTAGCYASLRPDSRFCPRCGSAVSPLSAGGSVWA